MIGIAQILTEQISLVAPILGVSIGSKNDKTTWRIDFAENATQAQREAAKAIIDNFEQ
jgi:hypothetical protein